MPDARGNRFSFRARARSFRFAFRGIMEVLRHQHNFRIHLIALILAVIAGFFFRISLAEWMFILIISALVLCLEIVNTAIEYFVDLVSPGFNEKAGMAKDLAAAAVLLAAVFALIGGTIIFGKHLLDLILH